MPLDTRSDPAKFPNPDFLTLSNMKRGVITLVDQSNLPRNAAKEMTNLFLTEDGAVSTRPGVGWYGADLALAIDGFDYFDFNGAIHLVVAAGGNIYRSTNDGTSYTLCTGATYTATETVLMNQYNNGLYLTTGANNIIIYDGSTVLTSYSALATPSWGGTPIAKTGLGATTYTYYYCFALANELGYSAASTSTSIQVSLPRTSWDATTNYLTITLPTPVTDQERVDLFISEDNINFYYIDSIVSSTLVPNVTYKDFGSAPVISSTLAPTVNTTQGPKVEELTNIGARMFGVRDRDNRYRIWYSSGSAPYGAFSSSYDGGYLDWVPGGKYFPVKAVDYRDKGGNPVATIWCDSADGEGCVLQMSLDETTVGEYTVTTPNIYRLAGSRGTNAPGSVCNVLNDYMFYNSQAFYNMGSRAQFLNLISTDESSANIRPSVRTINSLAASGIASTFFEAKVYISVPYGDATSNSHTIVYDTEQKAWMPTAFTIGFSKFIRYTSSDGNRRLLAYKAGDTRLSEISDDIRGDYGIPFETTFISGLYPVAKDRFEFQFTEEAELELTNSDGAIYIDILGVERKRGYVVAKSATMTGDVVTTSGWDTGAWDVSDWDDTSDSVTYYTAPSNKKYFPVQREMNSIQWRLYTNSLEAYYTMRTLQTWGTVTYGGHPSQWRLTS